MLYCIVTNGGLYFYEDYIKIFLRWNDLQLMEFLSDTNEAAAADVLEFVREAIQRFDSLRPLVIEKMLEVFHAIKSVKWV